MNTMAHCFLLPSNDCTIMPRCRGYLTLARQWDLRFMATTLHDLVGSHQQTKSHHRGGESNDDIRDKADTVFVCAYASFVPTAKDTDLVVLWGVISHTGNREEMAHRDHGGEMACQDSRERDSPVDY